MNRLRGITLIEVLIAGLIMTIAVVGLFATYSAVFKTSEAVTQQTQAEEISNAIIETARVYGPANIPTGTYNSSTLTGTWSGAYTTSGTWTTGATAYYNFQGVQVASSTSTGAYFSVVVSTTDTDVSGSGTTYTVQSDTLRALVVTVSLVSNGQSIYTLATNLIEEGA